ncbi:MAG: hypothetical protein LUB63_03330, partial [Oscillospiraceae bacterium]|nr:hypothetical protein [Oscillospiraceae bacterium]
MERKSGGEFLLLAAPAVYLVVAVAVTLTVCRSGVYPSGSDMMYHLYRGQRVYAALKDGVLWPGLDWLMYNGMELLRWISPVPAYGAALGIWLAGGDVLGGYLVLIGLLYFLNAVSWLLVGQRWGRPRMGAFLGLIWFFLPFNLYMLFAVGDLGYTMGAALLPPLISLCCQFVSHPKWTRLPEIALCSALLTLCSVECPGIVLPGLALLLLFLGLWNRCWREGLLALLAAGAGLAATGVWLCACVLGKPGG